MMMRRPVVVDLRHPLIVAVVSTLLMFLPLLLVAVLSISTATQTTSVGVAAFGIPLRRLKSQLNFRKSSFPSGRGGFVRQLPHVIVKNILHTNKIHHGHHVLVHPPRPRRAGPFSDEGDEGERSIFAGDVNGEAHGLGSTAAASSTEGFSSEFRCWPTSDVQEDVDVNPVFFSADDGASGGENAEHSLIIPPSVAGGGGGAEHHHSQPEDDEDNIIITSSMVVGDDDDDDDDDEESESAVLAYIAAELAKEKEKMEKFETSPEDDPLTVTTPPEDESPFLSHRGSLSSSSSYLEELAATNTGSSGSDSNTRGDENSPDFLVAANHEAGGQERQTEEEKDDAFKYLADNMSGREEVTHSGDDRDKTMMGKREDTLRYCTSSGIDTNDHNDGVSLGEVAGDGGDRSDAGTDDGTQELGADGTSYFGMNGGGADFTRRGDEHSVFGDDEKAKEDERYDAYLSYYDSYIRERAKQEELKVDFENTDEGAFVAGESEEAEGAFYSDDDPASYEESCDYLEAERHERVVLSDIDDYGSNSNLTTTFGDDYGGHSRDDMDDDLASAMATAAAEVAEEEEAANALKVAEEEQAANTMAAEAAEAKIAALAERIFDLSSTKKKKNGHLTVGDLKVDASSWCSHGDYNRQIQASTVSETIKRMRMEEELYDIKRSLRLIAEELLTQLYFEREARLAQCEKFDARLSAAVRQAECVESAIRRERREYQRKIRVLKKALEETVRRLRSEKSQKERESQDRQKEREHFRRRFDAVVQGGKKREVSLQAQIAKSNDKLRQEMERIERSLKDQLDKTKAEHQLEIQMMQKVMEAQLDEKEEEHSREMEKMEAAMKGQLEENETSLVLEDNHRILTAVAENAKRGTEALKDKLREVKSRSGHQWLPDESLLNGRDEGLQPFEQHQIADLSGLIGKQEDVTSFRTTPAPTYEILNSTVEYSDDVYPNRFSVLKSSPSTDLPIGSQKQPPSQPYTTTTSPSSSGADYLKSLCGITPSATSYSAFGSEPRAPDLQNDGDYLRHLSAGQEPIVKFPRALLTDQPPSNEQAAQYKDKELSQNTEYLNSLSGQSAVDGAPKRAPYSVLRPKPRAPDPQGSIDLENIMPDAHPETTPSIHTTASTAHDRQQAHDAYTADNSGHSDYVSSLEGPCNSKEMKHVCSSSYSGINDEPRASDKGVDYLGAITTAGRSADESAVSLKPVAGTNTSWKHHGNLVGSDYLNSLEADSGTTKSASYCGWNPKPRAP